MLVDTHVHLNDIQFKEDLEETIQRAHDNDVKRMIVVGYDVQTNKKAIELSNKYPSIYATVGFHPTIAKEVKNHDFELLEEQLKLDKVVGVGECGLDYYWDKEHFVEQEDIFRRQIELSKKYNKPLIIHMRDAIEATLNILRSYDGLKGVMHSYSGSAQMMKKFIDLGFYISLGGPVTFKNAVKPKQVAKEIDLDKLLIETDSPYLSPHPFRGKRNEPARVKLVAQAIALEKNVPYEVIAENTTKNAKDLFKL
jgi:TatD DNase family protein